MGVFGSTGAWITWIPTWVNFTIGNGTNSCSFIQFGKTVFFKLYTVLGTTSVMGSLPTFTLPVASVAVLDTSFPIAHGFTNAPGGPGNMFATWQTTTTALLRYWDTNNNLGNVSSTTPGTWASTNTIQLEGFIEAA